jgi:enoyl-[acyl-carrier protein] reductase I
MFKWNKAQAPLKFNITLDQVGGAAAYLLSDLAGGVTGEVHFVDAGYNIVGVPPTATLNGWTAPDNGSDATEGTKSNVRESV